MDSESEPNPAAVGCAECLQSIILFITFILPYGILILPSWVLGLESYESKFLFALAALALTIIFGNLYYVFSLAPQYFGPLGHNWGCTAQLTNWVVLLTHIITISLPHLQIFTFPAVAVLIAILFPIMEATFWVLVGSGREKAHLHVYGDIHDWIVVKWGNFLMGGLEHLKQALEWVVGGLEHLRQAFEWVVDLLIAFMNFFPHNQQPEETVGLENPPPYSSNFHTYHSVCNTPSDMTVTAQGAAAKV
ncbi:hypothetical protein EDD22DRAFT_952880 [Suillus occidentalis]|nr:hypothetical protein EDD22DRAFT_952880 [Suillus occidentalis]